MCCGYGEVAEHQVGLITNSGEQLRHGLVFGSAGRALEVGVDHNAYRRGGITTNVVTVGYLNGRVGWRLIEEREDYEKDQNRRNNVKTDFL